LACHVSLPAGKTADVEIVNIFERSEGPDIRFETDGFGPVTDCTIDGKKTNFGRWLTDNNVDTKLPLVADYNGALINVSVQGVGLPGPFTFGEIAYQLLNQTMVYCDVVDAGVPHEGGRYFAQQMATAH